jgi:hypothetical protein
VQLGPQGSTVLPTSAHKASERALAAGAAAAVCRSLYAYGWDPCCMLRCGRDTSNEQNSNVAVEVSQLGLRVVTGLWQRSAY